MAFSACALTGRFYLLLRIYKPRPGTTKLRQTVCNKHQVYYKTPLFVFIFINNLFHIKPFNTTLV
jgi:hypothetical protein